MGKNSLDQALNEALDTLSKIEASVLSVDKGILSAAKSARKLAETPMTEVASKDVNDRLQKHSEYIKQVNAQLKEQKQLNEALQSQIAKLANAKQQSNVRTTEEIENQKILARNAREYAKISSKLSGEYTKQSITLNGLRRRYKDLSISKEQGITLTKKEVGEMNKLEKEITELDGKLKRVDASVGQHQRSVGNYGKAWGGVKEMVMSAVAAFGIYEAINIGKEIFQQIKEIDGLNKALLQVSGSIGIYAQAQEYINELAEETGVGINTLQRAYTKFYASAKTTNLTLEETQNIFRQTAKAGAILGLSTEEVNGAMRAMEQILSKGKVQAEEIRGQLGERLPGAFQILAKSMGLTTAELNKQLELGNVISDEVLPGFAEELERTFSLNKVKKVETLNAAQGRLSNSWNLMLRNMEDGNGLISKVLIGTFELLASKITSTSNDLNELGNEFDLAGNFIRSTKEDIKNLTGESSLLVKTFEKLGVVGGFIVDLFSISIFEAWAEGIKLVRVSFSSSIAAIKKTDQSVRELFGYLSNGELDKAYKYIAFTNKDIGDSFTREWDRAYKAVKINRKKIQAELDAFVEKNGSLAPLKKDAKFWNFMQLPLEDAENSDPEGKGGAKGAGKREKEEIAWIDKKNQAIEGSVGFYEMLRKNLQEQQKDLAVTSKEYQNLSRQIELVDTNIKIVSGTFDGLEQLDLTPDEKLEIDNFLNTEGITKGMKNLSNLIGEDHDGLMKEFVSSYEWDYNEFLKFSKLKMKGSEDENTFKKEKLAEWLEYSSDVIYQVGALASAISERKIQKYQEEIDANNKMYDEILAREGLTEQQRKEAEEERRRKVEELDKKKKIEQNKQAKINKATAIFDIALNSAAAVVRGLAEGGLPLAILYGTLGALQLATAIATPIPKYKDGRKGGKEELAITGDGGVNEFITDKYGKLKSITSSKPTLTHLSEGDKVLPDFGSYLDSVDMDALNRASIMASLSSQAKALNQRESGNNLDKEILKAIKEGNNKKQAPMPVPDYGILAREFAKEMKLNKRANV